MAGNCLTLADRREIERLYAADEKPSVIAAAVGVSVATISVVSIVISVRRRRKNGRDKKKD